jgi:superoxide dismutase, Fe-Mn family
MSLKLPDLPYDFGDLEPAMSRDSLVFHFSQQQRGYFDRVSSMVRNTDLACLSLEELIRATANSRHHALLHRLAAGIWNHNFFWESMRPTGGGAPHGPIAEYIDHRFGSYAAFAQAFQRIASALFSNGWLWLLLRNGTLEIVATANSHTPLVKGETVLLGLDVWEHAYYLDHQNRRAAYVTTFLEELVNWDLPNRILEQQPCASVFPAPCLGAQLLAEASGAAGIKAARLAMMK